jgi:hypothetical protein
MVRAESEGSSLALARLLWLHQIMTSSIPATKKSRGRPATGVGKPIQVRLQPALMGALDNYISLQPTDITHAEAIRRILVEYLRSAGLQDIGELDRAISGWISEQSLPKPSRQEAIRCLLDKALKAKRA